MVMRADVLAASLDAAALPGDPRPRLIMSPRGAPFTQAQAREWAAGPGLVILCPRFEGVDERRDRGARAHRGLGRRLCALGRRHRRARGPRRLRQAHSRRDGQGGIGRGGELRERPARISPLHKPARVGGPAIPDVLLSGDHAKIAEWRRREAERITTARRPDLAAVKPTMLRPGEPSWPAASGISANRARTLSCGKAELCYKNSWSRRRQVEAAGGVWMASSLLAMIFCRNAICFCGN